MAKNLVKLRTGGENKIAKLRKAYEWAEIELDSLDEMYEEKKQAKLDKKARRANKRLARPAFLACDKAEYLDALNAEKLCEFDMRNYLSYRAAYHKAARSIFTDIKKAV